jgi:ParB family chromosome partitioning protein
MNILYVPLDKIVANPFQVRHEDPQHVKNLAISIAANGLLQIPTARAELAGKHCYQLAFGHSRLAAFKWIRDAKPLSISALRASTDGSCDWTTMPLNIVELTDQQMFEAVVAENMARKDLDPIEQAMAMVVYRDKFGKTSVEIGTLFGLSDSAVRNKMRLLKLPENLQVLLSHGELPEGAGRALVNLFELSEAQRTAAEEQEDLCPSVIIEAALSGAQPEAITGMINKLLVRLIQKPDSTVWSDTEAGAYIGSATRTAVLAPEPALISAPAPMPAEQEMETTPAPIPIPPPASWGPMVETAVQAPRPAPAAIPAPPAPATPPAPTYFSTEIAPAPMLDWAHSTITLTLTYWPEDGNPNGRTVMIGGRLNQLVPVMRMSREKMLQLPIQLSSLIDELQLWTKEGEK